MTSYVDEVVRPAATRIPLNGELDLTNRCNNQCLHCWIGIPIKSREREEELTFDEIVSLVDQARELGCRTWKISGGEPMLRPDFYDVFDYITRNSASYSLNTNATLLTPRIARLMTRNGKNYISLYGATADVHDSVTRNPGAFEAAMQGLSYLRKAGARFTIGVVPMKANYHQMDEMISLAESLGDEWGIGAWWLSMGIHGNSTRNKEIISQRLSPKIAAKLRNVKLFEDKDTVRAVHEQASLDMRDRLLARCNARERTTFHIDPYGRMASCAPMRVPYMRYDLRKGSFAECWDEFIPSMVNVITDNCIKEYEENCGSCSFRIGCECCPAFAYLEHRRCSAKIEYLCKVETISRELRRVQVAKRCRYYHIAGITIRVELPTAIRNSTFNRRIRVFEVSGPGDDNIMIKHVFSLPNLAQKSIGKLVLRRERWSIYTKEKHWIYIEHPDKDGGTGHVVVFNEDYTNAVVYNDGDEKFRKGNLPMLLPTINDRVMLCMVLADRNACYFHSSSVSLDGNGLLFIGPSTAGKSTITKLLADAGEVISDERVIVRRWPDGFRVHGAYSHNRVKFVSPNSAPLKAIFFLNKSFDNRVELIDDKLEITRKLISSMATSIPAKNWWEKILALLDRIVDEIPCYELYFDKSCHIVDTLRNIEEVNTDVVLY